jgi:hypothetical protein
LVVRRGGWTCKVVNSIHLGFERVYHIVSNELKSRVGQKVDDIVPASREKIIQADYFVPFIKQSLTEMRT